MISDICAFLVWPGIVALPLTLTQTIIPQLHYSSVFPSEWYDLVPRSMESKASGSYPSPLGLSLGLGAVVVGQFFMLLYFIYIARPTGKNKALQTQKGKDNETSSSSSSSYVAIQKVGARSYELKEGLMTHLAQPEGFVMLGSYLIGTWMYDLMPSSYYSFHGSINWYHVILQLLLQDAIQYGKFICMCMFMFICMFMHIEYSLLCMLCFLL